METGIAVEFEIPSGPATLHYILKSWDTAYNFVEDSMWLIEPGEQFTIEQYSDGNYGGTIGFEIISIPETPYYPLATVHFNYTNQYDTSLSPPYIVDNNTIAYFQSIGTTEIRTYGGESRNGVIIEDIIYSGTMIYDIDTGLLLEADIEDPLSGGAITNMTLISWSISPPPPEITIITPLNSQAFDSTPPDYEVTIIGTDLNSSWYTVNGGDPIYFAGHIGDNMGTIDTDAWVDAPEGSVVITFYANDTAGRVGNDTITINKDITAPVVSITSPTASETFGLTAPGYVVNIIEANLDTTWYTVNGESPIYFAGVDGENKGTIDTHAWDDLPDGPVVIRFYANDTVGTPFHYEITITKDATAPIVNIVEPDGFQLCDDNPPDFNVTITEVNLNSTWYTVNGGESIYFAGADGENTGTIDTDAWDDAPDGPVVIRFYANDTAGTTISDEVTIIKDTLVPVVLITSPGDSEIFGSSAPGYVVDITEANLETSWYTLNGGEPIYFTGVDGVNKGTINTSAWVAESNGLVVIIFYANDTAGTTVFDWITVYKEATNPIVIILNPSDSDVFNSIYPEFNVSIIESNISSTWYTLNRGNPIYFVGIDGMNIGTIDADAWDALADGEVVITFYAEDAYGNIGLDEVTVIKNSEVVPPGIPGFDIFIVIGTIGLISCIIVLAKFKKRTE